MGANGRPSFLEAVAAERPLLSDGGIETRIMFETSYAMDPDVQVAAMVADPVGRPLIREVYSSYVAAAEDRGVPIVIGTPTFRASRNFAERAGRGDEVEELNLDAAAMHAEIRDGARVPVYVAGVLGPARDAYTPADALAVNEAAAYHAEQAAALAAGGVDLLFAATFPAVDEAVGAGRAMAASGLPTVVSLVLGGDGRVLDGSSLADAIARLDAEIEPRPAFVSLSCVHPSVAAPALEAVAGAGRVLECKANGSPLPTAELIRLDHPESDAPQEFAAEMWDLHVRYGLRVIGGCCGTSVAHIEALAGRIAAGRRAA